jgi:serralysin
MRSKFATDPLDASDGFFNSDGAGVYSNFLPASRDSFGNTPANGPQLLPVSALSNEAIVAASSQTGPTSTVTVTSGGITFNLIFDAAATAAPASFQAGIEQAASILAATISDKITVNVNIDYSGTGGGASAGPAGGQYVSYTTVKADLTNAATPGDSTFALLPTGSTIQGQSYVAVWDAELKLFGLLPANNAAVDGSATFATDINASLLVGVALHELTHAMGRVPEGPPYSSSPDIFDLFRFTSPGVQLIAGGNTAPAAYFSLNGGNTKLADLGQTSDPSDFLNSGVQGPNDPFNEFYTGSTTQNLTTVDKQMLDALGFHITAPVAPIVIESFGSTELVQVGNNYFLDSISTGTGPEVIYGSAPLTLGEFPWTPIGAEPISGGYEIALKYAATGQYTIWITDSSGNVAYDPSGSLSGNSTALEAYETSFHQDLNGDGVIGIPATAGTAIESLGSTSLVQVGNDYFLDSISGGTGPELQYGGAPLTTALCGAWTPIGAEATATGYEVAFKVVGSNEYTVWNTDSSGNITNDTIGTVAANSTALEALEPSFHQDLNGDGVIGIPAIESFGSTSLVQIGNDYFLDSISGGTGPELQYGGAPLTTALCGAWTPIGAEATATGYEVAFQVVGANEYTVWNTDSSGNITNDTIGTVAGNSTALEVLEPSFHQDLNGDGVIGIPGTIESSGSTSLVQVGNNYFLDSNSTGTGPEVKYGGAPLTVGEFAWTPIGAEQISGGYEMALKSAATGQYTIWITDSSGNVAYDPSGNLSANSTALETYETSFHQDLNGDGVIGIPGATGPAASTPAAQAPPVTVVNNDTFVFRSGLGAGVTANAGSTDTTGHDGFAWVAGNAPAAALPDAQAGLPHPLFQLADGDPSHHDGAPAMNFHTIDPHAGGFIIG